MAARRKINFLSQSLSNGAIFQLQPPERQGERRIPPTLERNAYQLAYSGKTITLLLEQGRKKYTSPQMCVRAVLFLFSCRCLSYGTAKTNIRLPTNQTYKSLRRKIGIYLLSKINMKYTHTCQYNLAIVVDCTTCYNANFTIIIVV
jgi:hypothetical protein